MFLGKYDLKWKFFERQENGEETEVACMLFKIMISLTQVNGNGENGPITCLGKYHKEDGEEITISDTFTLKGSIQLKINLLTP